MFRRLAGACLAFGMPVATTCGLPAETFIRTGERTAVSYFVQPLTDCLARAFRED